MQISLLALILIPTHMPASAHIHIRIIIASNMLVYRPTCFSDVILYLSVGENAAEVAGCAVGGVAWEACNVTADERVAGSLRGIIGDALLKFL